MRPLGMRLARMTGGTGDGFITWFEMRHDGDITTLQLKQRNQHEVCVRNTRTSVQTQ